MKGFLSIPSMIWASFVWDASDAPWPGKSGGKSFPYFPLINMRTFRHLTGCWTVYMPVANTEQIEGQLKLEDFEEWRIENGRQ